MSQGTRNEKLEQLVKFHLYGKYNITKGEPVEQVVNKIRRKENMTMARFLTGLIFFI